MMLEPDRSDSFVVRNQDENAYEKLFLSKDKSFNFDEVVLAYLSGAAVNAGIILNNNLIKNHMVNLYENKYGLKNFKMSGLTLENSIQEVKEILSDKCREVKGFGYFFKKLKEFSYFNIFMSILVSVAAMLWGVVNNYLLVNLVVFCVLHLISTLTSLYETRRLVESLVKIFSKSSLSEIRNFMTNKLPVAGLAYYCFEKDGGFNVSTGDKHRLSYYLKAYSDLGINLFMSFRSQRKRIDNLYVMADVLISSVEKFYLKRDGNLSSIASDMYYASLKKFLIEVKSVNGIKKILLPDYEINYLNLIVQGVMGLASRELGSGRSLEKFRDSVYMDVLRSENEFEKSLKNKLDDNVNAPSMSEKQMESFWSMLEQVQRKR